MSNLRSYPARIPRSDDVHLPVYDGDTLTLEICTRPDHFEIMDLRLQDVFAPEMRPLEIGAIEAQMFVRVWLAAWAGRRWPYIVTTPLTRNGNEVFTFKRVVSQVWSHDLSSLLNTDVQAFVVENGYTGGIGS